jgi:hypothetical protein
LPGKAAALVGAAARQGGIVSLAFEAGIAQFYADGDFGLVEI